jgi:D-alanine-D-alanine ligase
MKQLPNIALIAGGYSGESEVSVRSSAVIMQNIDRNKFNVYLISVTREHWHCLIDNTEIPVDKNDFSITYNEKKITFDSALIMIHGTPGEDGVLQGYFDILQIPYTTCDATVSAVTFNKYFCSKIVKAMGGALVAESFRINSSLPYDVNEIAYATGFPCFVKPNAGGSSIGTTKVHAPDELRNAIEIAFREDDEVLIESFINGREITCGVIRSRGELISFPLTEVVSKKEFFDFEAKYDPRLAEEITPAPIDETLASEIRKLSEKYYDLFHCKGVVRFDYIVEGNKIWFLEVNTIPGMSAESIVPQQAKAFGWSYTELTTRIIEESLRK